MRESANTASNTPKTSVPISTQRIVGTLLLQASHSAEQSEPMAIAAERKPKPVAPLCSTFVAKRGSTTLKFEPKSNTRPTTRITSNTAGVFQQYATPSRRLCQVFCRLLALVG